MIHRLIKLGLLFLIIMIALISCTPKPYWVEHDGMFYTCDISRAQEEIPFTIIFPSYLPHFEEGMSLERIEGTLKEYQSEGRAEIMMIYSTRRVDEPFIVIKEYNYPVIPGNPNINPEFSINQYKAIDLVISDRNEDIYFYYNYEGIYYNIHYVYISFEEAAKVVESMLKQLY